MTTEHEHIASGAMNLRYSNNAVMNNAHVLSYVENV